MAGEARQLLVGAGGVVADETVDVRFVREVVIGVLPVVARVARGAEAVVGGHRRAVVVDDVLLSEALIVLRVEELPGPVGRLLHLLRRLGVAFEAGVRDRRPVGERLLQLLELGVIGGRFRCGGLRPAACDREGRDKQRCTHDRLPTQQPLPPPGPPAPWPPAGVVIIGGAGLLGSNARNFCWSSATLPITSPTMGPNILPISPAFMVPM